MTTEQISLDNFNATLDEIKKEARQIGRRQEELISKLGELVNGENLPETDDADDLFDTVYSTARALNSSLENDGAGGWYVWQNSNC